MLFTCRTQKLKFFRWRQVSGPSTGISWPGRSFSIFIMSVLRFLHLLSLFISIYNILQINQLIKSIDYFGIFLFYCCYLIYKLLSYFNYSVNVIDVSLMYNPRVIVLNTRITPNWSRCFEFYLEELGSTRRCFVLLLPCLRKCRNWSEFSY